ncbi:MAG: YcgL domain-containing protein [Gammaproteobacteria bacterium]|jgi:uncharacterized protein YcgL (UPF0745 family)|nr:MAG: YcgL domain-containing protein [Gammaproteobacteria bacterium]
MQCLVYKSLKQFDYYLYVNKDEELQRVPDGLKRLLGRLQKVLELELGSGRTLAQADVEEVLRQIEERGYYLQMPPRTGVDIPVA